MTAAKWQRPGAGRGGRHSSVGITTRYGTGQYGDRIPVGMKFSAPVQTGPGDPPSLLYYGYRGVNGRGVVLITHHHLALRLKEE